ncbi:MAG: DUF3450 family protein [Puniceicoccales bacterium]
MILDLRLGALIGVLAVTAIPGLSRAQQPANDHATLLEWVRTEKLISEERADWAQEKVVLEGMLALLAKESAQLDTRLQALEAVVAESSEQNQALAEREATMRAELAAFREVTPEFSTRASSTVARWPEPLRLEIAPTLRQIESAGSDDFRRGRLWLEALQAAGEFNDEVTVHRTQTSFASGKQWEVREVYFGLAGGYWTTADGTRAGAFAPVNNWERLTDPALSPSITRLIAVAERREPADTVAVPVTVD